MRWYLRLPPGTSRVIPVRAEHIHVVHKAGDKTYIARGVESLDHIAVNSI
jgi:hypothetical protein